MRTFVSTARLAVLTCGTWAWMAVSSAGVDSLVTLRLRDASIVEVLLLLAVTGQGYVVDGDVLGNVNVEIVDATPAQVEGQLTSLGLHFTSPGKIRRVSMAEAPELQLTGAGFPVDFVSTQPFDVRDFLRLMMDITGSEVVAPAGSLGSLSLLARDLPVDDALAAGLATVGLQWRRAGERIEVWRPGPRRPVLLPVNAGGIVGHVAYREGDPMAMMSARSSGMAGFLADELDLAGLFLRGREWHAVLRAPDDRIYVATVGGRTYDGVVESVDEHGVVVRKETGETIRWNLRPELDGVVTAADDLDLSLARARARADARDFDGGEEVLSRLLAGDLGATERHRVRAALADLQFQWSQDRAARGELEAAIRHLEAALEIDRPDRPWQAAEDLNEIGKAWTALNEPERAVGPHREALAIARSGAIRKRPQPFTCGRPHERTPWVEADALDGLANAERARGRLSDAAKLYGQSLAIWKKIDDPTGRSTALTGLGLVHHGLGRFGRAAELHREALALPSRHPVTRAILLNNLGSAQLAMRQMDAARASLEEAVRLYRELEYRSGEGTALNNLGTYWETRREISTACETYASALVASREADDRRGAAITLAHLERLLRQDPTGPSTSGCRAAVKGAAP